MLAGTTMFRFSKIGIARLHICKQLIYRPYQTFNELLYHLVKQAEFVALSAIRDDYKTNRRCEFAVVKEAGWSIPMSFGVPKNGPFTEEINRA